MKWLLIIPAVALGVILALFILALLLRVGIRMLYSNHALQVWVKAGPVSIRVFPIKKKQRQLHGKQGKGRRRKKQSSGDNASQRKAPASTPKDVSKTDFEQKTGDRLKQPRQNMQEIDLETICAYVRFGFDAAGRLMQGLRVDKLWVKADIAADDAAKTALAYGGACAAVSNLLPLLDRALDLRRRDFTVNACFDKNRTELEGEVIITAMIGRMALIGLRIWTEFGKLKKAVSKNEQPQ